MNKFNFDKVLANLNRVKQTAPMAIANLSKNYFLSSWQKQGFDGKPWKAPNRQSKKGKSSRLQSATLVQTGKLRRGVANSLISANWNQIKFRVDVDYAGYNNFGTENNPQRQFMGQTKELTRLQMNKLKSEVDKIWR